MFGSAPIGLESKESKKRKRDATTPLDTQEPPSKKPKDIASQVCESLKQEFGYDEKLIEKLQKENKDFHSFETIQKFFREF